MRAIALLCLVATSSLAVTLEGSTDSLEVVTAGSSVSLDYSCAWANVTATALTTPGTSTGNIAAGAPTTTTIIAAPSASNWRHIKTCNFDNAGSVAITITVQIDRSGNNRVLFSNSLGVGEHLTLSSDGDFHLYLASGAEKTDNGGAAYSGRTFEIAKVATATDAAGYHYLANKDNGFPGAWSVGTPGVNGVSTACDVVGTAGTGGALSTGSPVLPDPSSGSWYLTRFGVGGVAAVNTYVLMDVLWYNTGLTVTTTTAQAITTPAWPARDTNGSTNGEGVGVALYALTALGNAAAVSNSTLQYTNSDGTAGRTGTFTGSVGFQAPATPVIGTWMPFQLQAGDRGVRSIQSVTLNTTYTSGTMMLVAYRNIALDGAALANGPSGSLVSRAQLQPGIRVYNDTCFAVGVLGSTATTAPSFSGGIIELMER